MKTLRIIFAKKESEKDLFVLPEGFDGVRWLKFKNDYMFILNDLIRKAKKRKAMVINIKIDILPELSDNYDKLVEFMEYEIFLIDEPTVKDWNNIRDKAKQKFTAPVISKLDTSGLINDKFYNIKK